MDSLTVLGAEIRFSNDEWSEPILVSQAAKRAGLSVNDFIEDLSVIGELHYIVQYENGFVQRITLPKDEVHPEWGYVFENFIYSWCMLYEWRYKKEIGEGKPFQIYPSLYEAYADWLTPEEYQVFLSLSEEEVLNEYGSPWKVVDEIAHNEEQMDHYFDQDPINSKALLLDEGIYFDYFLETWITFEPSLEVFRQLYLSNVN